ncbi:Copper translocating P-type ATPase, partial [mine drainage metagenome]
VVGGGVFIRGAYNALKNRSANMDTLVALGTLSALVYSLLALVHITPMTMFMTQGLLLFFIRSGKILELAARNRAVSLLEGTTSLLPDRAFLITPEGETRESPINALNPGDLIRIPKGDRVPADGILESGEAFLDESLMTGESLPVRRTQGEAVIGGSANTGDPIRVRITQTGTTTVLGRMILAIRRAQNDRPPIQHLADRIASVFVPVVILIAMTSFAVFSITTHNLSIATTALIGVLMVACPCAMGLATPTAILVGSSVALRQGMIFRRGSAMETFAKATRIVF